MDSLNSYDALMWGILCGATVALFVSYFGHVSYKRTLLYCATGKTAEKLPDGKFYYLIEESKYSEMTRKAHQAAFGETNKIYPSAFYSITAENAPEKLAAMLMECAERFGNFPQEGKQVDIRAWNTLLIYSPYSKPVGYISSGTLENLLDPSWQEQRNETAHLWTINNPPSRATIPLYLGLNRDKQGMLLNAPDIAVLEAVAKLKSTSKPNPVEG